MRIFRKAKLRPIKIRGNNVDFLTIEITLKKVRGNEVEIPRILVFDLLM